MAWCIQPILQSKTITATAKIFVFRTYYRPGWAQAPALCSVLRGNSSGRRLKLNVKHHRTTQKPEIYRNITAEKDEAALAIKSYRAPKRTQAAQQQQQKYQYIHTRVYKRTLRVYKRRRFPKTRDLWRKSASMGYRVRRVSLNAVSRWSRSLGRCGYIWWCVFLVSGGIS